jgi:hypothetical protein
MMTEEERAEFLAACGASVRAMLDRKAREAPEFEQLLRRRQNRQN